MFYTRRVMTRSLVSVQVSESDMSLRPIDDTCDVTRDRAMSSNYEVEYTAREIHHIGLAIIFACSKT
jgi:hypothetical protein